MPTPRVENRLALFAVLALVAVWPTLPLAAHLNEFRDAQVLSLHEHAAFDTVTRFGQLPLWNPYYCGGLYGLGAPQSHYASPFFLVSLFLGPDRAEPVVMFVLFILGMEGTYRFLRLRNSSALACALVAPVFALSGQFAVALFRGWTNFFGFELAPWLLYGVALAARGRPRGIAIAAIAFATVLGLGGTFAAPILAIAAIVEGSRSAAERGTRAFGWLATAAVFVAGVAAFRLWPVADTLLAAPRLMAGTPGNPPLALVRALGGWLEAKDGNVGAAGGFYVGAAFFFLVSLGGIDRRSIRPFLIALVFVWLAAGYARKPALFSFVRAIPGLAGLRYPERFLWIAILYFSEPAARAVAKLPYLGGATSRRRAWSLVGALLLFTVATELRDFFHVAGERHAGAYVSDAMAPDFHQSRGNRWLAAHYPAMGIGSLSCWEPYPVRESPALRGDLPAEEYLLDPDAGRVERRSWTPNRIVLEATTTRAARLRINQNFHPGWRTTAGVIVSDDGLLAVDLPAGKSEVVLDFRPTSAFGGLVVSLVSLVLLVVVGRSLRAWMAAALVPPLVFVAFLLGRPEPAWPAVAPRNANGAPAIVEVADGAPLAVRSELPVELAAARLDGPDVTRGWALDIWLRRTGTLPHASTLFVDVERREGPPAEAKEDTALKLSHQVVAGSFFLADAPAGALLDDVTGFNTTTAAKGTWDIWVAVGPSVDPRKRAALEGPGVVDRRVRIATFVVR